MRLRHLPLLPKVGLILTGGGARAAYQVGVLRAVSAMLPKGVRNPFPVICGTSAGAINATSLAVSARNFHEGVRQLVEVWENFHVNQVYRSDPIGMLYNSVRVLASLLLNRHSAISLLDDSPLTKLLGHRLPFRGIQKSIKSGALHALGITAWGYTSGQSVTFYQGAENITPWGRKRRIGISTNIGVEHLAASSAIPFLFPAMKINREYFGDGSMRQLAPISPALHLGAERILVIGVHDTKNAQPDRVKIVGYPPMAQIAGHVMNSIFLDSLDVDLERLQRINEIIQLIPRGTLENSSMQLRPIKSMVISPSEEINKIAEQYAHTLPLTMRLAYRAIGAMGRDGSTLLSYLLFEKPFCQALIKLGHQDTMSHKSEILQFIGANVED
ncbi:MAG: patatin-like phospholipase family protein [Betaproteobacteria bacterium]|nr:MAG: patatin-like phospholipase family protein [Betaproteobacteria bacterium]